MKISLNEKNENLLHWNSSLELIPRIGPKKKGVFERNSILTSGDLCLFFPRTYLDKSNNESIQNMLPGNWYTFQAQIVKVNIIGNYKSKRLVAEAWSNLHTIELIFFANVNLFLSNIRLNEDYLISGRVSEFRGRKQIVHPELEILNEEKDSVHMGRLVPIYAMNEDFSQNGISQRFLRERIHYLLENIQLPATIKLASPAEKKMTFMDALKVLHFPENLELLESARERIIIQEFLEFNLKLEKIRRQRLDQNKERIYQSDPSFLKKFQESLPFTLTADQLNSIEEILQDLQKDSPMLRLLEGDVGSGKTVVALAAIIYVANLEYQIAMMLPTEILARQQMQKLQSIFMHWSLNPVLLLGGNFADKDLLLSEIKEGKHKVIIGTHALIQEKIQFNNLALAVIDEQHRFGVEQRRKLLAKGKYTDCLLMSATPIPRSLSLTIFGEMDLSLIKTIPPGRQKIETLIFPQNRIQGIYNSVRKYIEEGRQVFWIFPLIEESELLDLKSLQQGFQHLSDNIFTDFQVQMLHGKMLQQEKDAIMKQFAGGNIHILISTTVIEVGIDVPNASIMIIEHPERFGLSQLHQLRGRVGRGDHKSFCILILPEDISSEAGDRLEKFGKINNGFEIAELDLQLRGSGDFFGTQQHGSANFKLAQIHRDFHIFIESKEMALDLLEKKTNHPENFYIINRPDRTETDNTALA